MKPGIRQHETTNVTSLIDEIPLPSFGRLFVRERAFFCSLNAGAKRCAIFARPLRRMVRSTEKSSLQPLSRLRSR